MFGASLGVGMFASLMSVKVEVDYVQIAVACVQMEVGCVQVEVDCVLLRSSKESFSHLRNLCMGPRFGPALAETKVRRSELRKGRCAAP
jgi:hypothetical protein